MSPDFEGFARASIKIPQSKSEAEAAEFAYRILHRGAHGNRAQFDDPADDWVPIWVLLSKEEAMMIGADEGFANDPIAKEVVSSAIGQMARQFEAIAIGYLSSVWMVQISDPKRQVEVQRQMLEQNGSTEGIPERVEKLLIMIYTAGHVVMHTAPIERHPDKPPTLGEFDTVEADDVSGRVTEPLQEALQRIG